VLCRGAAAGIAVILVAGCGTGDGPGGAQLAGPAASVTTGSSGELSLRSPSDSGSTSTMVLPLPTLSDGATTTQSAPEATDPPAPETTTAPATTQPPATDAPSTTEVDQAAEAPAEPVDAAVAPTEEELAAGEDRSLILLNELRASVELESVARDSEMDTFAREWSRHMAETGEFAHSTGSYGENIAFTSDTSLTAEEAAERFHQLWMDSEDHLANMTSGQYALAGVGLYRTERGWYGTHVFFY
jgi:uncharacterized protein YkwD